MKNDFRERAFLPVVLPLAVVIGFFLVAFSLSRVFLAVPAMAATFTALAVAGYVLLIGGLISARPRVGSTALGVGVVVGLVGVVAAGAIAMAAGPRELHPAVPDAEPAAPGEEPLPPDEEPAAPDGDVPEDAIVFTAVDIDFVESSQEAPAGDVPFALVNEGAIHHDVSIDELGIQVEADPGETVVETVSLQSGTYRYYCSVPGHAAAGMEGTLTVP